MVGTGSHYHFKHSEKKGKVTVPHPKKDLPVKTLISIEKQAGLRLRYKESKMKTYIATVHKDSDSDYGVQFYDFPGCITAGSSIEEAGIMATEALTGHIELMSEDGDLIPDPTPLETIISDPDHQEAIAFLVIHVSEKALIAA
jgi:predicted RNase H-like HicB family nuclease